MHIALGRTDHRPWPMPTGRWIWRQRWLDLLFAHWRIPVDVAQRLVPCSVQVQEFDGSSWVGLVPFRMEDVMFRGVPAVPWLSRFPEMNLRLYVTYQGKPGVWFVSLDATNPVAVWGARQFAHLPYFEAAMDVRHDGDRVRYESVRKTMGPQVAFNASYWPTSAAFEAKPGSIEHFLVERYRLYTVDTQRRLVTIDIQHQPWPLQQAAADIQENTVVNVQGLAVSGPPLLLFSRRLDVIGRAVERLTGRVDPIVGTEVTTRRFV
jgi:uncharacterized protein